MAMVSSNYLAITFDNTAGAFAINNGGGGTIKLQGDITNNSTSLQTLNFPVPAQCWRDRKRRRR